MCARIAAGWVQARKQPTRRGANISIRGNSTADRSKGRVQFDACCNEWAGRAAGGKERCVRRGRCCSRASTEAHMHALRKTTKKLVKEEKGEENLEKTGVVWCASGCRRWKAKAEQQQRLAIQPLQPKRDSRAGHRGQVVLGKRGSGVPMAWRTAKPRRPDQNVVVQVKGGKAVGFHVARRWRLRQAAATRHYAGTGWRVRPVRPAAGRALRCGAGVAGGQGGTLGQRSMG